MRGQIFLKHYNKRAWHELKSGWLEFSDVCRWCDVIYVMPNGVRWSDECVSTVKAASVSCQAGHWKEQRVGVGVCFSTGRGYWWMKTEQEEDEAWNGMRRKDRGVLTSPGTGRSESDRDGEIESGGRMRVREGLTYSENCWGLLL